MIRCKVLEAGGMAVAFDAGVLHCVLPWKNCRVVLLGFTPGEPGPSPKSPSA